MPKYNRLYFCTNNIAYILGIVIDELIFICVSCTVKELPDIQRLIFNNGFGGKLIDIYTGSTDNKLIRFKSYCILIYSCLTQIIDFQGLPLKIFENI